MQCTNECMNSTNNLYQICVNVHLICLIQGFWAHNPFFSIECLNESTKVHEWMNEWKE